MEGPKIGDAVHFVLYYSAPEPGDPSIIGQCRAGWVSFVHEDGSVDITYLTGGQINEPDNPPSFVEHKIRRFHALPPAPNTWHYCAEHP